MQSTVSTPLARRHTTTDYLLDTPLPQLLAALDVELVESSLRVRGFTGYVIAEGSHLVLALPPDREESERDMIVRQLLGTVFRVPMPELPEPYQITDLDPALLTVT